eukprot:SAG31_NODE_26725_length_437_cov_1.227811_1_plen_36_part_10
MAAAQDAETDGVMLRVGSIGQAPGAKCADRVLTELL